LVDRKTGIFNLDDAKIHKHYFDVKLASSVGKLYRNDVDTVVDVGCGIGMYSKFFTNKYNWKCIGLEGTKNIKDISVYNKIKTVDLSKPIGIMPTFDLVFCLEVGEHIPKQYEKVFIDNIISMADKHIVLSWGIPTQKGKGHVNLRENSYIKGLLHDKGFKFDIEKTCKLRENTKFNYFNVSVMAFERM
jgi:cyclopropane fatty-acyl-phospholipid synthase-like methyltransferase